MYESLKSAPAAPSGPAPGQPVRVLVSRTRPPAFLDRLAERIELTLIPMGSAGAKAAADDAEEDSPVGPLVVRWLGPEKS